MTEMINYLNAHSNICKGVLVFGQYASYHKIKQFIDNTHLNEIVVAGYFQKKHIENIEKEYKKQLYFNEIRKVELYFVDLK